MYLPQPIRLSLLEKIKQHAGYVRGKVLDVGAGSYSRYRSFFSSSSYLRMDVFEHPNIDVVATAEEMPFEDSSFDSIVCTQVLEDIPDPMKAVGEFYRVLVDRGHVLLTTGFLAPICGDPTDSWRFTDYGLRSLFEKQGFTVIRLEPIGGFHGVKAQMNIRKLIEKFSLYESAFGRLFGIYFRFYCAYAMWRDRKDPSKIFAHGWIIIAQKSV
jgi:SAM-dependent methyltransferase